eukprot:6704640-Karenia_brevis.AAC.1
MGSKSIDFPYVLRLRERGRLSAVAENELRVGPSMGSKSIDFPYVWSFQARGRLSAVAENQLR